MHTTCPSIIESKGSVNRVGWLNARSTIDFSFITRHKSPKLYSSCKTGSLHQYILQLGALCCCNTTLGKILSNLHCKIKQMS